MVPAAIVPPRAACHVIQLADWRWIDSDLETWTREQLPDALERRRVEFAAGRVCAAQVVRALSGAAAPPHQIGRTPDGGPAWPPGLVGSIAHSRQIAGAIGMRRTDAAGIGLDIEPMMAPGRATAVARRVATGDEFSLLQHAGLTQAAAVTLAFSAKEALFKCLHPLVGTMFHLGDARVDAVDLADGEPGGRQAGTGSVTLRLGLDLGGFAAGQRFRAAVGIDAGVVYAVVTCP